MKKSTILGNCTVGESRYPILYPWIFGYISKYPKNIWIFGYEMDIYPNDIQIFFGYLDIKRLNLYPKNIRIFFGYISDIYPNIQKKYPDIHGYSGEYPKYPWIYIQIFSGYLDIYRIYMCGYFPKYPWIYIHYISKMERGYLPEYPWIYIQYISKTYPKWSMDICQNIHGYISN